MAEFLLTYDTNGGVGEAPTAATLAEGVAVTLPEGTGITKVGFNFGGWSETDSGDVVAEGYVMPGAATTLYAVWTAVVMITITYDVNGGVGDAPDATSAEVGTDVALEGVGGMTKAGFDFGGWATTAGGVVPLVSPYKLAEDITVFAIWVEDESITITYDANGGTGTPPAAFVGEIGGKVTLRGSNGLEKEGYIFGGWAESSEGTDAIPEIYTITGDATVYAIWVAKLSYADFIVEADRIIKVCRDLIDARDYDKREAAVVILRETTQQKIRGEKAQESVVLTYNGFGY